MLTYKINTKQLLLYILNLQCKRLNIDNVSKLTISTLERNMRSNKSSTRSQQLEHNLSSTRESIRRVEQEI